MRAFLLFCAASLLAASCGRDVDVTAPPSPRAVDECDTDLDSALRRWEAVGFSGAVAIVDADGFRCRSGYGLADREADVANGTDTVFSIGSITKTVTAAAVLALVDDGALELGATAGEVLSDLDGPAADVTIGQLLTHTSGITGNHGLDHEPLSKTDAINAIGGLELAFEPGTDNLYSNAGVTLLGLIIEEASGQTYRQFLVDRVLTLDDGTAFGAFWDGEPAAAGPRAVGYLDEGGTGEDGSFAGPHWGLDGNGGVAMSPANLAAWTRALMSGEIISEASLVAMTTAGDDLGDGVGESAGFVVVDSERFGTPLLASSGGGGSIGHNMALVWLPERSEGIAIASNAGDLRAEDLLETVLPAVIDGEPLPSPQAQGEVDPEVVDAAVGTYELDGENRFDVAAGEGGLVIAATGRRALAALFPPPEELGSDSVDRHERNVRAFLAGETPAGREELEILSDDLGELSDVTVVGTAFIDELRTYVTITTDVRSFTGWYALGEQGQLAGALLDVDPPVLDLVPTTGGVWAPIVLDGGDPQLTISFDGEEMVVEGPAGTDRAARLP